MINKYRDNVKEGVQIISGMLLEYASILSGVYSLVGEDTIDWALAGLSTLTFLGGKALQRQGDDDATQRRFGLLEETILSDRKIG